MKDLADLERRLKGLKSRLGEDGILTTDENGERTWIRGQGCGIRFMFELLKFGHDHKGSSFSDMPKDMQEQIKLWSRAEVDGDDFGALARSNREAAREILGLPHGGHL